MQPGARMTLPFGGDVHRLRRTGAPAPEISVVVPCFNEEDNVEPLLKELASALEKTGRSHEVIYVDDGSEDKTAQRIGEAMHRYPFLRMVRHRTNCGESAAILSGCASARGEILVTLDADLQDDPADIPAMVEALVDFDCVTGVRTTREDSMGRIASSWIANRFRRWMLGDDIQDAGCTFRVYRRSLMECVVPFRGFHRFAPTIWRWQGFRIKEMTIHHRPRHAGVSKVGTMDRLWVGIDDIFGMRWFRRRFVPPGRSLPDSPDREAKGH